MSEKPYSKSATDWNWEVVNELQDLDYEENAYLEYKSRLTYDPDSEVGEREWRKNIEREFTAFANAHGGIVLFGMTDNRKPSGVEEPKAEIGQIISQYVQNTTPQVKLNTSNFIEHPYRDKMGFVAVEVKEANSKPVATGDSAFYVRTAHGKAPMTRENIQLQFVERDRRQQAVLQLLVEMDWLESAYDSHVCMTNRSSAPPFGVIDTEGLRDAMRNCTHLYTQTEVQDEIRAVLNSLRDIEELERNYGRHKSHTSTNPDPSQSWTDENVWARFEMYVTNLKDDLQSLRQEANLEQRFKEEF